MTTLYRFAAAVIRAISRKQLHIGFSQYTALPIDIANIAAGKCEKSGVAMHTASISEACSSSIFRKSW